MTEPEPDPTPVEAVCTCHTPDCPNRGYPITLNLYYTPPDEPNVVCGPCGRTIRDIQMGPDPEPKNRE